MVSVAQHPHTRDGLSGELRESAAWSPHHLAALNLWGTLSRSGRLWLSLPACQARRSILCPSVVLVLFLQRHRVANLVAPIAQFPSKRPVYHVGSVIHYDRCRRKAFAS